MNPWKAQSWIEFYSNNEHIRIGLRMHYDRHINNFLKCILVHYVNWIRKNYQFPIRINVYIKNRSQIKALDSSSVSATFFGPFDRLQEPYIKVAVGDFNDWIKETDLFQAVCSVLSSLAHEFTHYYQWVNNFNLTEVQEERQANYFSRKIVYLYLDSCGYDYLENLQQSHLGNLI